MSVTVRLTVRSEELGLSNYMAWEVAEVVGICARRGFVRPTVYQGIYNLLDRRVEDELFAALHPNPTKEQQQQQHVARPPSKNKMKKRRHAATAGRTHRPASSAISRRRAARAW